jgi:hypothetical protein
MKGNLVLGLCTIFLAVCISGCNAFMHGYTQEKAMNAYYLVTGDEKNFGDKRIKYNRGFHHNSALDIFLECKGLPTFIFEYKNEDKCRGIRLFYSNLDSVFVFEEPRKGDLKSVFRESRKTDEYERQTYQRLKSG